LTNYIIAYPPSTNIILPAIYRHSENAIVAFLLLLFIAANIFNIFLTRNLKNIHIKTKVFLIDLVKASFLTTKRPLPPVPIPI